MKKKQFLNQIQKIVQTVKPDEDFVLRSKLDMERMVRMAKPQDQLQPVPTGWRYGFAFALALIFLLTGIPAGLAWADSAKPGDLFYPVDKWGEHLERWLASQPQARVALETRLLVEHLEEYQAVSQDPSLSTRDREQASIQLAVSLEQGEEESAQASQDWKRALSLSERHTLRQQIRDTLKERRDLLRHWHDQTRNSSLKRSLDRWLIRLEAEQNPDSEEKPAHEPEPTISPKPSPTASGSVQGSSQSNEERAIQEGEAHSSAKTESVVNSVQIKMNGVPEVFHQETHEESREEHTEENNGSRSHSKSETKQNASSRIKIEIE